MSSADAVLMLVVRHPDGSLRIVPLEEAGRVIPAQSLEYALVEEGNQESPDELVLKRRDDDLVVEQSEETVLVIEAFFTTADTGFVTGASVSGNTLTGNTVDADTPALATDAAGDDIIWTANATDEDGGIDAGTVALGVGALVGLAALEGGGGSRSPSADPTPEPPPTEPPVAGSQVTGMIVAGPVIDGNGLTVDVFQADGETLIGSAKVEADGSFTIDVGDYTGVIIARVVDNDDGADYLDEATAASKDLNAVLSAMKVVDEPGSTVVVNLNALTTVAAGLVARESGSASPDTQSVEAANSAIARLFGLPDLHTTQVNATNSGAYNKADGLDAGEQYGVILAAFSGADLNNGGDSQKTIDDILTGLSQDENGQTNLNESGQALLQQGARTVEDNTGEEVDDDVAGVVDTIDPVFQSSVTAQAVDENSGSGQVIYTAEASDAGDITYSLADSGDTEAVSIDAGTGVVTLNENPDFETQAGYSFTVVATDAAGNSTEQSVSLTVNNQPESAPTITSGATAVEVDENSGADQVVYTATASAGPDGAGSIGFSLQGGSAPALSIDANTGEVTLGEDPDFETQDSYSFTVVATDAAGNSSSQAVSLAVNNLDEAAPEITSGATATAIDENSGADQVIYTATSTDDSDISTGSITYTLKPDNKDDASDFSIDSSTGAVTFAVDPDYEQQSGYSFTVVATDAADNSTEQTVTLNINDLDESAPAFTSGTTAAALDENSGAGQVIYTATATDTADVDDATDTSADLGFSLQDGSDPALSIDADTGEVTLVADPDHESQSSYHFTVVASDEAGNSTGQAVSLDINNLDDTAPVITSATTAAVDENIGLNQVVYTATADDSGDVSSGVSFSLGTGSDADLSIDPNTGEVTLGVDPDYETKSAYGFTVVAEDAVGNNTQQAVTLDINDIADEIPPKVDAVAITSATGKQNDTLNVGDTVTVTVTMSEDTLVDTTKGTPRIALNIDGSNAYANYVGGSGSTALTFSYAVQAGDTDANGISIDADALEANGGSLQDAAGNPADLIHSAVADDNAYLVDTTAPILSGSNPSDDGINVAVDGNIVLTFDETVQAGSGNITLNGGPGDTRTFAVTDPEVVISGNTVTLNPATALAFDTTYAVQIDDGALTDSAGNPWTGIDDTITLNFTTTPDIDTSTVVFDLVEGVSSDHSNRHFDHGVDYTIYIRVNSDNGTFSTDGNGPGAEDSWGEWHGAYNLDYGDQIVLVGTGDPVEIAGEPITDVFADFMRIDWQASGESIRLYEMGELQHSAGWVWLWTDMWHFNPNEGSTLAESYSDAIPEGVLVDQGLAELIVTDIALTAASGNQGDYLNAGDTVDVTVTVFESVTLDTAGGNPTLSLDIGGAMVEADYLTGSGSNQLVFRYTIDNAQTDLDGIVLPENALALNGATLQNVNGANLIPDSSAVAANGGFRVDTTDPSITSGATATALDENSGAGQSVYTAQATDDTTVSYSLKAANGDDAADFSIDSGTGVVSLTADPNFESKDSYSFTVVATDAAGNSSEQAVTLGINNLDESAPSITSGATATAIDENSGADQVVYTATSTDADDISTGSTSYSLKAGSDAALSIDADTGAVTLSDDPDHETQNSYSFTVVATDAAGNSSEQTVTLGINDLDESAPTITSGATATAIDENSGADQVVYTATSTDADDISTGSTTYSLKAGSDAALSIDANTGAVTLSDDPDHETQNSYSFTVVATDAAGNSSEQAVTLGINNLDESAPSITSGASATAIDENSGADQVVYTATSTDDDDISTGSTSYSLKAGSDAALSIDASTGAVTLSDDPDFETQNSYSFTVVATDAAGNSIEQAVTLDINDITDETPPSVDTVALTGATGIQNSTLNAGDTLTVTVTMSEATVVDTGSGTPRIALNVGGATVYAGYTGGSGSSTLTFTHTVQSGENDANGISIGADALEANGGTLEDATGNTADLTHVAVSDDAGYLVDTTVPTLSSSTPSADATGIAVGDNIVLTLDENVKAGSGNITIDDGAGDTRIIDVADTSQVSISGNQVTVDPTADLNAGSSYYMQIDNGALMDAAGNAHAGISDTTSLNFQTELSVDTSIVVFDMVDNWTSSHSGRTFSSSESYTIYLRVSSNSGAGLNTNGPDWSSWKGAGGLDSDDRVVLVGNGSDVLASNGKMVTSGSPYSTGVSWKATTGGAFAAALAQTGYFSRSAIITNLWSGTAPASLWIGGQFSLQNNLPSAVMSSQGLA